MKVYVILFVIIQLTWTTVFASEYDLTKDETVDIEILFPKQENPTNTVPSTADEREKSNRLINFIDRLLNRNPTNNNNKNNQAGAVASTGTGTGTVTNNNLGASLLATTKRNLLSSLIFIPDVNKGVDTILSGVASGNLEQIISGSFIFAPNRVQSVASTVINRVFGGQSISQINQNNVANNNANQTQTGVQQQQQQQQQQGNNNNAVNNVLQQLGLNNNGQQQQQALSSNNNLGQVLSNDNNLGQQQQQSAIDVIPQQQQQQNQQSLLNNLGLQQQQQTGNINPANNNNIQNLITGVLGQLLPNTAQTLQNGQQQIGGGLANQQQQ